MNKYHCKLLSHRLRSLAKFEQSRDSFEQIGALKIKYFELDTRVCKDGVIYVFHDHEFKIAGEKHKIASLTAKEINGLLPLDEALLLFSMHSNQDQWLCIDIKDYGFEKKHLDLVRKHDLEHRVIFITWIPQSIIRLKESEARMPLILSCWNISKLNPAGKGISWIIKEFIKRFGQYVVLGERKVTDKLQGLSVGYQHALVCTEIPEILLNILKNSGGGICIHKSMYCRKLGLDCRDNKLQLWLYNEDNPKKYRAFAENDLIHVIFSDVAPVISKLDFD